MGGSGPPISVVSMTGSEDKPSCFPVNALTHILYSVKGSKRQNDKFRTLQNYTVSIDSSNSTELQFMEYLLIKKNRFC